MCKMTVQCTYTEMYLIIQSLICLLICSGIKKGKQGQFASAVNPERPLFIRREFPLH